MMDNAYLITGVVTVYQSVQVLKMNMTATAVCSEATQFEYKRKQFMYHLHAAECIGKKNRQKNRQRKKQTKSEQITI